MMLLGPVNITASLQLFGFIPPRFSTFSGTSGTTLRDARTGVQYFRASENVSIRELSTNKGPSIAQASFVPTAVGASPVRNLRCVMRCVIPCWQFQRSGRGESRNQMVFNAAKRCLALNLTGDGSEPESEE